MPYLLSLDIVKRAKSKIGATTIEIMKAFKKTTN